MFTLDVPKLLRVLEAIPGLQRKDWERNQSGADRAMEAVLIQRAPREIATYALVRLRLAAMPELGTKWNAETSAPDDVRRLLAWSPSQGPGGTMLAKVIEGEPDHASSHRARAALASLRYYHRRDDANPTAKDPWTEEGLDRIASIDVASFLDYPTRGPIWRAKFETVKRLVSHIRQGNVDDVGNDAIVQSLKSVHGIGEQTASMAALFWLGRPVPILDNYLLTLLQRHRLHPTSFRSSAAEKRELARQLVHGARDIAARRTDWPANRVLSCLYLWACEVGRLHCQCENGETSTCPIVRGFRAAAIESRFE